MAKNKVEAREKRKLSIRKRMAGSTERPRLTVFRSAKHIYAQVVNDAEQKTLCAASTLSVRSQTPMRAMTKPNVIRAMLLRTQASNVRSLACSRRGSTIFAI